MIDVNKTSFIMLVELLIFGCCISLVFEKESQLNTTYRILSH